MVEATSQLKAVRVMWKKDFGALFNLSKNSTIKTCLLPGHGYM